MDGVGIGMRRWALSAMAVLAWTGTTAACGGGGGTPAAGDPGTGRDLPGIDAADDGPANDVRAEDAIADDGAAPDSGEATDDIPVDAAADLTVPLRPWLVMTFNLRTPFGDTDENAWEHRRPLVLDVVARHAPDLLGTQEGWQFQLDEIAQADPGLAWAGVSRTNSDVDEFCAVFWRTDLFDLQDSGTFWLGTHPSDPDSRFGPSQAYPRIATWVRLLPRDGTGPFLFLNTHVDYVSTDDIQLKSAALLVRKAAELAPGLPVILTGDFNAAPSSGAHAILTGTLEYDGTTGDFTDAWTELGKPEVGTFHGFTGTAGTSRIDWILHRGGIVARSIDRVTDHSDDGRYPSDHFPVEAMLERTPQ